MSLRDSVARTAAAAGPDSALAAPGAALGAAVAVPSPAPPLIGPGDPPVASVVNAGGQARTLILCDHAGRAVPRSLDRLGLHDEAFDRHIAYDIGAAEVARRLAQALDAPLVLSHYSRLTIDLNRGLADPTLVPEISDGMVIPANRGIDAPETARRIEALFQPYHRTVAGVIARMRARGIDPAIVSIHSFTPVMHAFARPWHVGVLWDRDPRIPVPLMARLAHDPALRVGNNQPYSGRNTLGGSIETHATPAGLPNALIEVRQDLIETEAGAVAWADRLAAALGPILDDDDLYRVEHFP